MTERIHHRQDASMARVAVFGATGHTGRFVVAELLRRGRVPVLVGRDAGKLKAIGENLHAGLETRTASVDDSTSLRLAFAGTAAVINCAGPFLDTATPVIEAALQARIHYFDVTAEQRSALNTFERFDGAARKQGVVVMPALAFYGGLADLLATAAMGDWTSADDIDIAIALDSWKPTSGTRLTGERNTGPRFVVSNGRLEILADPPPTRTWQFPEPFGRQEVVAVPLSEIVTISRHLRASTINTHINLAPLEDIRNPDTPPPVPADASGSSDQVFLMDVVVRKGSETRRATAAGRDIYGVTAPIVIEAAERVLDGRATGPGAFAAGAIFDAHDFLESLSPAHLSFDMQPA